MVNNSISYSKHHKAFIVFNGEQYAVFTRPSLAIKFFLGWTK